MMVTMVSKLIGFSAMITSAGIFYFQFVDLNSTRNLLIIGVSMYFGYGVPLRFLRVGSTGLFLITNSMVSDKI